MSKLILSSNNNLLTNSLRIVLACILLGTFNIQYLNARTVSDSLTLATNPENIVSEYKADISFGEIGKEHNEDLDNPFDNVFIVDVDNIDDVDVAYYLEYEVYGVQGVEAVSRSINERQSVGGYLIKETNEWTTISERVSTSWILQGKNTFKFTINAKHNYSYKIKDLRLSKKAIIKKSKDEDLHVNGINSIKDNQIYISGFVSAEVVSISTGGVSIPIRNGAFDFIHSLSFNEQNNREVNLTYMVNDFSVKTKSIHIEEELAEADVLLRVENKPQGVSKIFKPGDGGILNVGKASILVGPEDLSKLEVISITPLRQVDIVPLSSGMVNITNQRRAYRFLPHGLTFENEVFIEIPFDPELIPNGYEAKQMQSFYFDDTSKSWQSVQIDSIDLERNVTIIRTNHFTDYINGVIQIPESPTAAAYTPTTMSDIKAADPTAGMNIISPPSANQKGDASISYPLNIPAGRNGMTPNINLSYSSEGGSSWLGLGWGISVPSITLDTRWGAPVFDAINETELYMLNGQQLIADDKYYPHRHYEVLNPNNPNDPLDPDTPNCDTELKLRSTSSGIFYERKLGSFSKIERLGNSPSNYSWKVTTADGTIHYYGNDTPVVGNEQGTYSLQSDIGGIAQWMLRETVDKYGNNIKYSYEIHAIPKKLPVIDPATMLPVVDPNTMLPTGEEEDNLSTLAGGVNLYLSEIVYTGFNDVKGKYKITFESSNDPILISSETQPDGSIVEEYFERKDKTINGKNGFKQIDDRLLESISVFYDDEAVPFRRYTFKYKEGQFYKTLFSEITEYVNRGTAEEDENEFYTHEFDYHDDLVECESLFGEPEEIEVPCGEEDEDDPDGDGNPDPDTDGDGVPDVSDNCPNVYNPDQEPDCTGIVCGIVNSDTDSVNDGCDNCPQDKNEDQLDGDLDGRGDVCDNCDEIWNYDQLDSDGDGIGNVCDLCPYDNVILDNETDTDDDGRGDLCDNCPDDANLDQLDFDQDGIGDACDNCKYYENEGQSDHDQDGVGDLCDNCPYIYNPGQGPCLGYAVCGEQALVGVNGDNKNDIVKFYVPPGLDFIYVYFDPYGGAQSFNVRKDGVEIIDAGTFSSWDLGVSFNCPSPISCVDYTLNCLGEGDALPVNYIENNHFANEFNDDALFTIPVVKDQEIEMDVNRGDCGGASSWKLIVYCEDPTSPSFKGNIENLKSISDPDSNDITEQVKKSEYESYTVSYTSDEEVDISFIDLKGHSIAIKPRNKNSGITHQFIAKRGSVSVKSLHNKYSINRIGAYEPEKKIEKIAPILSHLLSRESNPDFAEHVKSFFKDSPTVNRSSSEECPKLLLSGSDIEEDFNHQSFSKAGSVLGSSKSRSTSFGGNFNFGIGKKVLKKDGLVSLSVGLGGSFSNDKSFVANLDMNGDGLVDIVKRENDVVNYYPHSITKDVNGLNHVFSETPIVLMDLKGQDFFKSNTSSFSLNIGISAGINKSVGGHAGLSGSTSKSKTEVFITDANGDGLPDISVDGTVFFNSLNKKNGIPTFSASSETTENLVVRGEIAEKVTEVDPEIADIEWPDFDVVKVWEAIHDGEIVIDNDSLLSGFLVSIETDNNGLYGLNQSTEIGTCRLFVGDSNELSGLQISDLPVGIDLGCSPTGISDPCDQPNNPCIGCGNLNPLAPTGIGIGCLDCPESLVVVEDVPDDTVFEGVAITDVFGQNTVLNGANTFYHASQGVTLGEDNSPNDFNVDIGGEFYAFINGCENNSTSGGISPVDFVGGEPVDSLKLKVRKGQRIYFRLHSDPASSNDEFAWDPEVRYTSISGVSIDSEELDRDGFTPHRSKYSEAFILSSEKGDFLPGKNFVNDQVEVYWPSFEVSNYKDDIEFRIELIQYNENAEENEDQEVILGTVTRIANSGSINKFLAETITFNLPHYTEPEDPEDLVNFKPLGFRFEVFTHSNVDLQGIKWSPMIQGSRQTVLFDDGVSSDLSYEDKFMIPASIKYSTYKYFTKKVNPANVNPKWKSYNNIDESIFDVASQFEIIPNLNWGVIPDFCTNSQSELIPGFCDLESHFYFVVTQNNKVVGKRILNVNADPAMTIVGQNQAPILINITDENSKNISIDLISDGRIWSHVKMSILDLFTNNPDADEVNLATIRPKTFYGNNNQLNAFNVKRKNVNLLVHANTNFGSFYRSWGQFLYNESQDIDKDLTDMVVDVAASDGWGKLINTNKTNDFNISEAQIGELEDLSLIFDDEDNPPNPEDLFDLENLTINENYNGGNDLFNLNLNPLYFTMFPDRTIVENGANPTIRESWVGLSKYNFAAKYTARTMSLLEALELNSGYESSTLTGSSDKGAYSLVKESRSRNVSAAVSVGHPVGPIGLNGGFNASIVAFSKNISDYFDINGDRYPDIVTRDFVQQTLQTGALKLKEDKSWENTGRSSNKMLGGSGSASGTFENIATPTGDTDGTGGTKIKNFLGMMYGTSVGISGSYSSTNSKIDVLWADINGDGLSDQIKYVKIDDEDGYINVSLNYGIKGNDDDLRNWGGITMNRTRNISSGLGVGLTIGKGESVTLGGSAGWVTGDSKSLLTDINGDGLLDYIYTGEEDSDEMYVVFNKGTGFDLADKCNLDFDLLESTKATSKGGNGAFTFGFPFTIFGFTIKPGVSVSGSFTSSVNVTKKSIEDYDGDGYPDYVEQLGKSDNYRIRVRHSNIKRTNKLKTINTPIGGSYTIDYEHLPTNFRMPGGKWVMSHLSVTDSTMLVDANNTSVEGPNSFHKEFAYHNGKQDRRERDFFGFEYVRTIDRDTPGDKESDVYRQNVVKYNNESYYLNGLALESYTIKGDVTVDLEDLGDDVVSTLKKEEITIPDDQIFTKTSNFYDLYLPDLSTDPDRWTIDDTYVLADNYDVGATKGNGAAYVLQTSTKTEVFELQGQTNAIAVEESMEYDEYGRITKVTHNGDGLEYATVIDYYEAFDEGLPNILSIPKEITVIEPNVIDPETNQPSVRRKRRVSELGDLGEPKKIDVFFDKGTSDFNSTELTYNLPGKDYNGNLYQVKHPTDQAGNYLEQTYTYDENDVNQYIEATLDKVYKIDGSTEEYSSEASYDKKFGILKETTDITDNQQIFEIDDFGRIASVQGPKDNAPSIIFEYPNSIPENPGDDPSPISAIVGVDAMGNNIYTRIAATTRHVDPQHPATSNEPANDIKTITITNGLGEAVQVKKDIEVWDGTAHVEAMSVSGIVKKDKYGRAVEQFHPTIENGDMLTHDFTAFLTNTIQPGGIAPDDVYSSLTTYDELDRPILTTDAKGTETEIEYDLLDNLLHTRTEILQSTGGHSIVNEQFADIDKQTIKTMFHDKTTTFEYDGIGQPIKTIDEELKETKTTYDWAGRRIQWEHPDAGIIDYTYDNLSRIMTMSTSNLGAETVNYDYDALGRIKSIKYPDYTSGGENVNNVDYEYWEDDVIGDDIHNRGRLKRVKDASGVQELHYGEYGEVIREIKSIVSPGNPVQTFEMEYVYDTWNRITSLIYPGKDLADIETVTYTYDTGGNLKTMSSSLTDFIKDIGYDHYEQKIYTLHGNDTESNYTYEPQRRFLKTMKAQTASLAYMCDNTYDFDNVGNITKVENFAAATTTGYPVVNPTSTFNIGGTYDHEYTYDEFNRLFHAEGKWTGDLNPTMGNHKESDYSLDMTYGEMHRITTKYQTHNRDGSPVGENTNDNDYVYGGLDAMGNTISPNAVNKIISKDNLTGSILNEQLFTYDANGNMLTHINPLGQSRDMLWDEKNMMKAILIGDQMIQHNVFDANGQRVLKGKGNMTYVAVNGDPQNPNSSIGNYTRYVNGYVVVGGNGTVTKHYYNGSERIVSRLAGSVDLFTEDTDIDDLHLTELAANQADELTYIETKLGLNPIVVNNADTSGDCEVTGTCASVLYFFHPDHLGSSTFLSDADGQAYQFLLYLPWGESMAEQKAGGWATPYKYTGKELDEEIGMYDYGARFYDPSLSLWTSVDPLAEKYPNYSAYIYVANNPLNAIDPDGKRIIFVNGYLGFGSPTGGEAYWGGRNSKFVKGAQRHYGDKDIKFTNITFSKFSTVKSRMRAGKRWVKKHYGELTEGLNKDSDDFKFVTHSMGAAFGEGAIEYLKKEGWNVTQVAHLEAYQADGINANTDPPGYGTDDNTGIGTTTIDYQLTNDPVLNTPVNNSGDISGDVIKLREKGNKGWQYRHREPIDSGVFWDRVGKLVNDSFSKE